MMNRNELELDNELAQVTDALLGGRDVGAFSAENAELVSVVRDIAAVIDPRTPPSAAFQQRLTQRLNAEWERANPKPALSLLERPVARLASLAATVVLVLGALLILAAPDASPDLQGAAFAADDAVAVLMLVGAVVVGFAYWRARR